MTWDLSLTLALACIRFGTRPPALLGLPASMNTGHWRRYWPRLRQVGMGKQVREGTDLRGLGRRIEQATGYQVIKRDGIAVIWVIKLPGQVGTDSGRWIEGARIDWARTIFSEVTRPLRVARNDG